MIIANSHINVGCSYHRIELPFQFMKDVRSVHNIYKHNYSSLGNFPVNEDTVLTFNRIPVVPEEVVLKYRKEKGMKIVVDLDDHWILYPHHEMAQAWRDSKANEQIERWLRVADMVWVTNERLRNAVSNINKEVHVVPNSLPFGYWQFTHNASRSPTVDVIYAGGSSHLYDLGELKGVMKRLGKSKEFGSNSPKGRIILAGYDREYGSGHVNTVWDQMLNIIKPARSYGVLPKRDVYTYMNSYNSMSIALAPLERNGFNKCKSNLKVLEAGCKMMPIIASYVEPYTQDMECPGVILCDTQQEWYEAIIDLVNDEHKRVKLGNELYNYVFKKYNMDTTDNQRRHLLSTLGNVYGR